MRETHFADCFVHKPELDQEANALTIEQLTNAATLLIEIFQAKLM